MFGRHGFTLVEVAIVLGVIGVVLGAVWTAAAGTSRQRKVTKLAQEILTIASGTQALYATRNSMSAGCLNNYLVNAGVVPADMVFTGVDTACGQTAIHDPWGLTVDVGSQTGWDGLPSSTRAFEILVGWAANNMTIAECESVLMAVAGPNATGAGLVGVGGQGVSGNPITNISTITSTTFNGCNGHFTLQYSIH